MEISIIIIYHYFLQIQEIIIYDFRFLLYKYSIDYLREIINENPNVYYKGKLYDTEEYIKNIKNPFFCWRF